MLQLNIEWAKLIFSIIAGALAAYWAFFTWKNEREKERVHDQAKRNAIYLNPFLLACDELQSRLYNILEKGGLGVLKYRNPNGDDAEEILYMIAQYFAYEWCVYRYSPYGRDRQIIELTEKVRQTFSTSELGTAAFCFFRPQQKSLGSLVRERHQGEFGYEFDVIPFQDFKQKILPALLNFTALQETLLVLKKAKNLNDLDLPVRERMARIQNNLVTIMNYIESKEGVDFNAAKLKRRMAKSV